MIWHSSTAQEVIKELKTNKDEGLNDSVAAARLHEYGKNVSVKEEEISLIHAITEQIKKPSLIILLSLLVIFVLRELVTGNMNFFLPIVGTILLLIKATLCIYAEYRSRNMLAKLINRIHTSAKVIRNGRELIIDSEYLVPGDIIKLTEGDYIPADARIIESAALRCDEAVLTGEKEAVVVPKVADDIHEDHTVIGARTNMLFCGCRILTGEAIAVVTETGENTEIRRAVIKDKVFTTKGIQDRIATRYRDFFKIFHWAVLAACALIIIFGTFVTSGSVGWGKFLEVLITAVCLYIAVVPGSFSTRIACMLALGIKRFEKDKAVIFNAQTLEKLAGVTVICSDKTGTLTQNKMSLRKIYDGEKIIDLGSDNISKNSEIALRFAALCCEDETADTLDHTEAALISAATRYLSIVKSDFDAEFPRMASIPLTPERKIKSTVNMIEGKVFTIVRGAPDIIISKCVGVDEKVLTEAYEQMCNEGLRVLAISYKTLNEAPTDISEDVLENNLQFLGLLGLADRERKGINKDIEMCRKAGISTVMFTGDHINTAASIGQKIGLLKADDLSVTGEQLETLSDTELTAIIPKIKVCARISADERVRMVNALHSNNETVLITADSAANFAPMAYADVGCAMGKTGTDVAIGNADVVVFDDSFSTIVKAIRNARGIFGNFVKYTNFYLSMCTCLFFSLLLHILCFGTVAPSSAIILLAAIFALLYPIACIGYETADLDIMKQPPHTIGERLFDLKESIISAVKGLAIAIPSVIVYLINMNSVSAASASFVALVISIIFYMLTSRSSDFFFRRIIHNRFLLLASVLSIIFTIITAATPLGAAFGLEVISAKGLLSGLLIPLSILVVFEAIKLYKRLFNKE